MSITAHTAQAAIIIFLTQKLPLRPKLITFFNVMGAFLSHFVLDFLPHWTEHYPKGLDLTVIPLMLDAGLALSLWWIYFGIRYGWRPWIGSYALVGIASLLPDIKYGLAHVFDMHHDWFDRFHEVIQLYDQVGYLIGLFPQAVIVTAAFLLSRRSKG